MTAIQVETKVAAGIEPTTQVLEMLVKLFRNIFWLREWHRDYRQQLQVESDSTSAVMLAISPLSFLAIADKFERAKQLESYSQRFKK